MRFIRKFTQLAIERGQRPIIENCKTMQNKMHYKVARPGKLSYKTRQAKMHFVPGKHLGAGFSLSGPKGVWGLEG